MSKRKFKIGQLVKVNLNDRVRSTYDKDNYKRICRQRDLRKDNQEELVLAKITGVKLYYEGKGSPGSKYNAFQDYNEAHLKVENSVTTWAVRVGYKNKELYFFVEDIQTTKDTLTTTANEVVPTESLDIPYFFTGPYPKHWREQMSRESKDWPRDKRGRWT